MSAFHATIGSRFAPLATLVDDAELDAHFNKAVTDTTAELLGKQRRKRKPWVTPEDLMKKSQKESKDYRDIERKIGTEIKMVKETWIKGQCKEVEVCIRKNNSKKTYQLVKDLTTEKTG